MNEEPTIKRSVDAFLEELDARDLTSEIHTICLRHAVTFKELITASREHHIIRARGEAMLHIQARYGWSPQSIAVLFGFDRATAASLLETTRERLAREFGSQQARTLTFVPVKVGRYVVNMEKGVVYDPDGEVVAVQ